MRINSKISKSLRFACILVISLSFTIYVSAQRKTEKAARTINISMNVVDDEGNPVPKAKVIIGEGLIHAVTDANGNLSFHAYPSEKVTINAPGFEKSVSLVQDLMGNKVIKLTRSKLMMTSDDDVPLPYNTQKKRHVTGSYQVLKGSQL